MGFLLSYFTYCKKHLLIATCDKHILSSTLLSGRYSGQINTPQVVYDKVIITEQPQSLSCN